MQTIALRRMSSATSWAVTLGAGDVPHTFTVVLRLSPPPSLDEQEITRWASRRRQVVQAIIEAEKPAHVGYVLHVETDRRAEQREG